MCFAIYKYIFWFPSRRHRDVNGKNIHTIWDEIKIPAWISSVPFSDQKRHHLSKRTQFQYSKIFNKLCSRLVSFFVPTHPLRPIILWSLHLFNFLNIKQQQQPKTHLGSDKEMVVIHKWVFRDSFCVVFP